MNHTVKTVKYPVIAVEGINGAGKSTLVKGLEELLSAFEIPVAVIKTPNYGGESGEKIKQILAEQRELTAEEETALSDFVYENLTQANDTAKTLIDNGVFVIFDRWLISERVYRKTEKDYDYSGFIEPHYVLMGTEPQACWDALETRGDARLRCSCEQLQADYRKHKEVFDEFTGTGTASGYETKNRENPIRMAQEVLSSLPTPMFKHLILDVDETVLEIIPRWIEKIVIKYDWARRLYCEDKFSLDANAMRLRKDYDLADYMQVPEQLRTEAKNDIFNGVYLLDDFYDDIPLTRFGESCLPLRNLSFVSGTLTAVHAEKKPQRLREHGFVFQNFFGTRDQEGKKGVIAELIAELSKEYPEASTGQGVVYVDDNQELLDNAKSRFPDLITLNPKKYNQGEM